MPVSQATLLSLTESHCLSHSTSESTGWPQAYEGGSRTLSSNSTSSTVSSKKWMKTGNRAAGSQSTEGGVDENEDEKSLQPAQRRAPSTQPLAGQQQHIPNVPNHPHRRTCRQVLLQPFLIVSRIPHTNAATAHPGAVIHTMCCKYNLYKSLYDTGSTQKTMSKPLDIFSATIRPVTFEDLPPDIHR